MAGENNDLISGLGAPGTVQLAGDLKLSSTTKCFVPSGLTTTQRNAISSPALGATIFNTTTNKLNVWTGSAWEAVTSA